MFKRKFKLILLFLVFINQIYSQNQPQPQHNKKVIGYYAQWAIYNRGYGVHQIEGDKLTHLMYAFYNTIYDPDTQTTRLESLDPNADFAHNNFNITYPSGTKTETERGNFGQLKMLKEKYPHLKILISLGGWTRSQHFPALSASENGRLTLAQNMVDLMQKYPWIGGFDIDWEFPVIGGIVGESISGNPIPDQPFTKDDHKNLVFLLKKIREVFDANGMEDKELSIAAGNNVSKLLKGHVGPGNQADHGMTENIFDFCDFITFFGYDFGGNWFERTSYNAPLYGGENAKDPLNRNIDPEGKPVDGSPNNPNQVLDDLVTLYLSENGLKVPPEKLILGIPFYGKLFERVESTGIIPELPGLYEKAPNEITSLCKNRRSPQGSWDDVRYPCEQSGSIEFGDLFQGNATTKHQYLDNTGLKVSSTAAAAGWKRYWDDTAKVPYLYNANENKFISYDDPESVDIKVKYALSKQMGGVMIWELSQDARDSDLGLLDVIDNSLLEAEYNITLNFKDVSGTALNKVVVELKDANGNTLLSEMSDSNGQVVFSNRRAFLEYNITYTYSDYSFLPSNVVFEAFEFDSDKTFNIIGSNQVVSLSGTVEENSSLLPDATLVLKDAMGEKLEEMLSTDGNYVFNGIISGLDYTLTAEKDYYAFNSKLYSNLSVNQTNQTIEGTRNSHTISGTIVSGSDPIDGVTVTVFGNGENYENDTDSSGNYTIADVPAGYNYSITPNKTDIRFLPNSTAISNLNSDVMADFEQNEGYIYGFVKDGQTPVSGMKVQLILNWASSALIYETLETMSDSKGMYLFDNQQSGFKISDYADFPPGGKITALPTYNQKHVFKPSIYELSQIPANPTQFDFNTQILVPKITINGPSTAVVSIVQNGTIDLEAEVVIAPSDEDVTVQNVTFKIAGQTITPTKKGDVYTYTWTPALTDFNKSHSLVVNAVASNNEDAEATYDFTLECTGASCPNILPQLTLVTPAITTINQSSNNFENIPITVTVTDSDGTIASVKITINEATIEMTSEGDGLYSYDFTPTNYQEYPFAITAEDNESGSKTLNETLNIIDSQFVPLPSGNIVLGYAHSWQTPEAPFLTFKEIAENTNYNVVMYSFIITEKNKYTPKLSIYEEGYLTNGVFDKQLLIDDIAVLRRKGVPVIASIGGATGEVELNDEDEKDVFVQGIKNIVDEYGFDGVDIDFEGASMNFGAGALTDFSYTSISSFPRLKYVVDAFKELKDYYGPNFIMTCAPETAYVQTGYYVFLHDRGSFLAVLDNLRDELDLIMVQLYNSGNQLGLDEKFYDQGTPDFLVAMSDLLLTGFETAEPGINFPALPASKIMVAIPACNKAAELASYIKPTDVIKALDYLRFGTNFTGRKYTLRNGAHPGLRGVMTWSINWDAVANCASEYEFSDSYNAYFDATASIDENNLNNEISIYPIPVEGKLTITSKHKIQSVKIYNMLGKEMHFIKTPNASLDVSFLSSGLYIVQLKTDVGASYKKILKK